MATKSPRKTSETPTFSLISNETLQQMYAGMLKCRILHAHAEKIRGRAPVKGKEAAFVGSTIDLHPEDAVVDTTHGAISRFLKGVPLQAILQQKSTDKGKRKPAVSSSELESALATGIAYVHHQKNSGGITVAFLSGDVGSPVSQAALHFAKAHKLPVIYVYVGDRPLLSEKMTAYGFPVIPVFGSDAVAVYRVAHECTIRTRRGNGPSMIACDFSVIHGDRDPLRNMEKYLSAKHLFRPAKKEAIIRAFEDRIARAKKASRNASTSRHPENVFLV